MFSLRRKKWTYADVDFFYEHKEKARAQRIKTGHGNSSWCPGRCPRRDKGTRGAQAVARGAARCASKVLDRDAETVLQTVACGNAMLPQQEMDTRQMSRRAE
jgi:hypothetical protein